MTRFQARVNVVYTTRAETVIYGLNCSRRPITINVPREFEHAASHMRAGDVVRFKIVSTRDGIAYELVAG
jgi:hypothetical protein